MDENVKEFLTYSGGFFLKNGGATTVKWQMLFNDGQCQQHQKVSSYQPTSQMKNALQCCGEWRSTTNENLKSPKLQRDGHLKWS